MKVIYNQEKIERYHERKNVLCEKCFSAELSDVIHTPSSDNPELTTICQLCEECGWTGRELNIFERIEK